LDKKSPDTAGACWRVKLAVNEFLVERKICCSYCVIRIIDGYEFGLGAGFLRRVLVRGFFEKKEFESNSVVELKKFVGENFERFYDLFLSSEVLKNFGVLKQKGLGRFF
jgi:hypothetical protein